MTEAGRSRKPKGRMALNGLVIRHFLPLLAGLIAFALYAPSLDSGFAWDSRAQVEINDFIHDPANLRDVLTLRVLGRDVLDFNRPLNLLSLMLDSMLWGREPFGYHLTSNLLHAATATLLCALLLRLAASGNDDARRGPHALAAFGAALLFAVHPVNTEAVVEISYREDLLVAFFTLGGLLAATARPLRWRHAVACIACFFLAATAKENGVAGPVVLAVCLALFRGDVPRSRRVWLVAAAALAVGAFMAARFALEPADSTIFTGRPAPIAATWVERLIIQSQITACYLRNVVWPANLCADYGPNSLQNFDVAASIGAVLLVICAQAVGATRCRLLALGAAVFWLALLPVANLVPIFRPMADRYLYLPLTGAVMMLAALPPCAIRRAFVPLLVAAGLLAMKCVAQQRVWHDSFSLWKTTAAVNPMSVAAANNLAFEHYGRGEMRESLDSAERALRLRKAGGADDLAIAALALDALGRRDEADTAFHKAVELDDAYADPDKLVARMTWSRKLAGELKVIAQRNPDAALEDEQP
jgi:protein O-mannosyl-transferase